MPLPTLPRFAAALFSLVTACALAQSAAQLQPLSPETVAAALERPIGEPIKAPRTSGEIDLKGKRIYIAEYLLLFDLSGDMPAPGQAGLLLGTPVGDVPALLAYRSAPDVAALQQITDRAWADLQLRLQQAGVALADAADTVRQHGAVYAATEPASTALAPVVMGATSGGTAGQTHRRYLVMAPTGMRMVPRTLAGIGLGNIAARVAYPAAGVEGLSLAMALNFSVLASPAAEAAAPRVSTFAPAAGSASGPAGGSASALSPLMELAPAPAAALVHAHAQLGLVNLAEALVLAGEFGRLRAAPRAGPLADAAPPQREALAPLLALGRRLLGAPEAPRVDALLELDGAATARLSLYALRAANQAIADALKAARAP